MNKKLAFSGKFYSEMHKKSCIFVNITVYCPKRERVSASSPQGVEKNLIFFNLYFFFVFFCEIFGLGPKLPKLKAPKIKTQKLQFVFKKIAQNLL